jgi:hypothetical protein
VTDKDSKDAVVEPAFDNTGYKIGDVVDAGVFGEIIQSDAKKMRWVGTRHYFVMVEEDGQGALVSCGNWVGDFNPDDYNGVNE